MSISCEGILEPGGYTINGLIEDRGYYIFIKHNTGGNYCKIGLTSCRDYPDEIKKASVDSLLKTIALYAMTKTTSTHILGDHLFFFLKNAGVLHAQV